MNISYFGKMNIKKNDTPIKTGMSSTYNNLKT